MQQHNNSLYCETRCEIIKLLCCRTQTQDSSTPMFQRLPQRNSDVIDVGQQCLWLGNRQVWVVPTSGVSPPGRRARCNWERGLCSVSGVWVHSYLRRGTGSSPAHPVLQPPPPASVHIVARRPRRRHGPRRSAWRRRDVRAARGDGRVPRRLPARRSDRCDRVHRRRSVVDRAHTAAASSSDRLLPRLGPRLDRQRRRRRLTIVQLAKHHCLTAM